MNQDETEVHLRKVIKWEKGNKLNPEYSNLFTL